MSISFTSLKDYVYVIFLYTVVYQNGMCFVNLCIQMIRMYEIVHDYYPAIVAKQVVYFYKPDGIKRCDSNWSPCL